jgi:hypothetical protein
MRRKHLFRQTNIGNVATDGVPSRIEDDRLTGQRKTATRRRR